MTAVGPCAFLSVLEEREERPPWIRSLWRQGWDMLTSRTTFPLLSFSSTQSPTTQAARFHTRLALENWHCHSILIFTGNME